MIFKNNKKGFSLHTSEATAEGIGARNGNDNSNDKNQLEILNSKLLTQYF
jgi:hypothetical protein